jgi:hypothetical protein
VKAFIKMWVVWIFAIWGILVYLMFNSFKARGFAKAKIDLANNTLYGPKGSMARL